MATISTAPTHAASLESLQRRMGRVNHQPVSVHSFTNKRLTVNFRAPIDHIARLLPSEIEPDEIPGTGMGMFGMCACDFWVTDSDGSLSRRSETTTCYYGLALGYEKTVNLDEPFTRSPPIRPRQFWASWELDFHIFANVFPPLLGLTTNISTN